MSGVFLLVALSCGTARAQTLANGSLYTNSIAANTTNTYTFTAGPGESVVLRAGRLSGSSYFQPWLRVYGPDGQLVESQDPSTVLAVEVALATTNNGTFTVLVSDGAYGGIDDAGTYQLNYFKVPGSFIVSAGDEGGALAEGALNSGTIGVGDIDAWSFTANTGQSVILRVGEVTGGYYFQPWLRVFGPDGALLQEGAVAGTAAQEITLTTTNSGTFTLLVSDGGYGGLADTGTYQLNYFKVPGSFIVSAGDEGGALVQGALNPGTVGVGDIDAWSFTANNGESVILRVGKVTGGYYFQPWLRVYGPDGALLQEGAVAGTVAQEIALTTTNSGTFTLLISDGGYGGLADTGTYQLNFFKVPGSPAVSPGDEGGPLTNGALYAGSLSGGDMDAWNFTASSGENVILRVGTLTGGYYFQPWLRVYGPDGALLQEGAVAGTAAQEIALTAPSSGVFTALVSDGGYGDLNAEGTYQLNYFKTPGLFVVSPGDEGGTLTNGTLNSGELGAGDIDAWSFTANTGDSVVLRVGELTGDYYFQPWLRVYGPDGALLQEGAVAGTAAQEIALTATNSGKFTVLAGDGSYGGYNSTGTYQLSLAHAPGFVFASPSDEGGAMTNGFVYTGTNSVGDLDVWSFYGTPGDSNMFRIATTNFTPWLRLYGPSGDLVKQAFTANTGNRTNFLSYVVTNGGNYTLVSSAYYLTQSGTTV